MALRIGVVAVVAFALARFVNWAVYSWAYHSRELGPWAKLSKSAKNATDAKDVSNESSTFRRNWLDHLPIIGWFRLRRESDQHGRGYWIRPLLIELLLPVAIAWYYHFYISGQALQAGPVMRGLVPEMHWQFLAHTILFV